MDDRRQLELDRHPPLRPQGLLLHLARRVVIEEIESALPHRDRLGVGEKVAQPGFVARLPARGLVRVDSEGRSQTSACRSASARRPLRLVELAPPGRGIPRRRAPARASIARSPAPRASSHCRWRCESTIKGRVLTSPASRSTAAAACGRRGSAGLRRPSPRGSCRCDSTPHELRRLEVGDHDDLPVRRALPARTPCRSRPRSWRGLSSPRSTRRLDQLLRLRHPLGDRTRADLAARWRGTARSSISVDVTAVVADATVTGAVATAWQPCGRAGASIRRGRLDLGHELLLVDARKERRQLRQRRGRWACRPRPWRRGSPPRCSCRPPRGPGAPPVGITGSSPVATMRTASRPFQRTRESASVGTLALDHLPRLAHDEILVGLGEQPPERPQGVLESQLVHRHAIVGDHLAGHRDERVVVARERRRAAAEGARGRASRGGSRCCRGRSRGRC